MYPRGELDQLAERKRILQARIDVRRWECAAAAAQLTRPIKFIDRGVEVWRNIGPFVKLLAIPAGIMLTRFAAKRRGPQEGPSKGGKIAAILAALPLIMKGVKVVGHVRAMHAARKAAAGSAGVSAAAAAAASGADPATGTATAPARSASTV
jgi:hypothetical protein